MKRRAAMAVIRATAFLCAAVLGIVPLLPAAAATLAVDGGVLQAFSFPGVPATPPACEGMRFDELVVGTPGDDVLGEPDQSAQNHRQLVFGLGGDDTLYGGNQDDCLVGGDGNDLLVGGNGKDFLDGEVGGDVLIGGNGSDTIVGGDGDDIITGGNGKDVLDGGAGNNICDADAQDSAVTNCSPVATQ